jgi:glycosyltransferase involved in cell wall biosynthesis
VRKILDSIARHFGYELRKIKPPSPDIATFLKTAHDRPEFDVPPELFPASDGRPNVGPSRHGDLNRNGRKLIVEGWRFIPHSYAMVNQWQLLALARRPDIALKVVDVPFYRPRWREETGLFEHGAEQVLRSIESAAEEEAAETTLRIFFPYDFSPSRSDLTAVFGTCESQVIRRAQLADFRDYDRMKRSPPAQNVRAVTPSRWSAEGFYRAGFKEQQVLVVPHGIDPSTFHPMPALRAQIRSRVPVSRDDFVFLSIGGMSSNKGIDLLLQAFTEVSQRYPHARLVLKGVDPLYRSKEFLAKSMQKIPADERSRVLGKIAYFGGSFPNWKMALLYQVADCYVSPYRAEGFNMPVLEAAASGIPVVCTSGGSTDDFVTDAFARKIESKKYRLPSDDGELSQLEPHLDHLIALMRAAIEDHTWRAQAAASGPVHAVAHYSWDSVVDLLVRKIFQ